MMMMMMIVMRKKLTTRRKGPPLGNVRKGAKSRTMLLTWVGRLFDACRGPIIAIMRDKVRNEENVAPDEWVEWNICESDEWFP